jgi:hypothetical protein
MNPQWQRYKELELIPDSVLEPGNHESQMFQFERAWQAIANIFIPEYEPEVSQTTSQGGEICWSIYDPSTKRTSYFESEIEVRLWLNQYYGID